jgi:plasmid stabilization system protein ParE
MPPQSKAVKLHAEARVELQESIAFYRERAGERWAAQFKQRVAEGLRAIAANPERYPSAPDLPGV